MHRHFITFTLSTISLFQTPLLAWNNYGHMTVAYIAELAKSTGRGASGFEAGREVLFREGHKQLPPTAVSVRYRSLWPDGAARSGVVDAGTGT